MIASLITAFVSAFIFGLGLAISGMTLPAKVIGFLDITGAWDPSLMAVMGGAIAVHSLSYRLIKRRSSPLLATTFQVPQKRDIDWKLVTGAILFGAGWGLGGFCPGPAIVSLVSAKTPVIVFVLSMIIGMYVHNEFNRHTTHK
jgi:uncharacterized membrane protein YedE/YeeE